MHNFRVQVLSDAKVLVNKPYSVSPDERVSDLEALKTAAKIINDEIVKLATE